jgi:hypothetical protein
MGCHSLGEVIRHENTLFGLKCIGSGSRALGCAMQAGVVDAGPRGHERAP